MTIDGIVRLHALSLNVDTKLVEITSSSNAEIRLQIDVGRSVDGSAVVDRVADKSLSISWPESNTTLVIECSDADNATWMRYHFRWQNHSTDAPHTTTASHYRRDNIRLASGGNWYGGPELAAQTWPLTTNAYPMAPYVAGDVNSAFGSGLERYWLASNRYAVHVSANVPLWVEHKDGRLSLQAQIVDSIYENFVDANTSPILEYSIYTCKIESSLRAFHSSVVACLYATPLSIPDERMIVEPVWTTWARYKADIDQRKVLEFADEIVEHRFPISQLELDDAWATKYGDFTFDPNKFPDPTAMCASLTKQNIRLTLWMHPFINMDSVNGRDQTKHHMFVQDGNGAPCIADWWHGKAYVVDFTNATAVEWFVGELETLRTIGVHSFKFDAGELNYFPRRFRLNSGSMPNDFARAYVEMASRFGGAIEIRVFSGTQRIGAFIRTLDRYSSWNDMGLDTILPIALNFSLLGYPFNLPDMIGGNAYRVAAPDKELYIRWLQTNVFLLAAQFSFAPWQFDAETVSICRAMLQLRAQFANYLLDECRKCLHSGGGAPVIRPMWWLSDSEDAYVCHDQFLVGDDVLVAPILTSGERERTVFLPEGEWKSCIDDVVHRGPVRIGPLSVPLERLLYFVRHRESTSYCQIF